jgi:hypothetical protein
VAGPGSHLLNSHRKGIAVAVEPVLRDGGDQAIGVEAQVIDASVWLSLPGAHALAFSSGSRGHSTQPPSSPSAARAQGLAVGSPGHAAEPLAIQFGHLEQGSGFRPQRRSAITRDRDDRGLGRAAGQR